MSAGKNVTKLCVKCDKTLVLFDMYSVKTRTQTTDNMFDLIDFTDFCKHMLNLVSATHFKKVSRVIERS